MLDGMRRTQDVEGVPRSREEIARLSLPFVCVCVCVFLISSVESAARRVDGHRETRRVEERASRGGCIGTPKAIDALEMRKM